MANATFDELFAQTLQGAYDNDDAWQAVNALRSAGTREIFDKAVEWCRSNEPLKRARGADILSQIGKTSDHPTPLFAGESFSILMGMLGTETDPVALSAIITAFGHLENPSIISQILPFSYHPNADVRYGLAFALGCFADDERSISTLLKLMTDQDTDVRDWATFGLGVLGDFDSSKIRDALFKNLGDEDEDVREEAMVGLAKRRDLRSVSAVIRNLEREEPSPRALEAANFLLERTTGPYEEAFMCLEAMRKRFPEQG